MAIKETDNQRIIMETAEDEFLEKGYANTKTTEIARRAGVTHAMLHYYFRTKENLFDMIFENKVESFAQTLLLPFDQDLPFLEKLKKGIENHFDAIAAQPRLPFFIFSEILNNEERKQRLFAILLPKASFIIKKLETEINEEVAKGNIHPIVPLDLIFDILSLNIFVFVLQPVITGLLKFNEKQFNTLLQHRKESNVALILGRIRK